MVFGSQLNCFSRGVFYIPPEPPDKPWIYIMWMAAGEKNKTKYFFGAMRNEGSEEENKKGEGKKGRKFHYNRGKRPQDCSFLG